MFHGVPHRRHERHRKKRVGLVLGAGGPVGHAYHSGVLSALQAAFGWDAREADVVVGTSAGAQVGALLRAGLDGDDLAARAKGEPLSPEAQAIARHYVRPYSNATRGASERRGPASIRFLLEAVKRPGVLRPGRLVSALLPEGSVELEPQAHGFRNIFGDSWPERPLWITAVHLDDGSRVAFGKDGAPPIDVGTAVTCSGAVPGVARPVRWGGRRYVDGGIASATHLDLLHDAPVDVVIVSSPLSMFTPMRGLLWNEIRTLEKKGVPVVAFEPRGAALEVMGYNPMDATAARVVVKAAYETTLRQLEKADDKTRSLGLPRKTRG
jgi:NTE family protein